MEARPNVRWPLYFVHDQLFDGTKFRALTVIDTHTKLSSILDARLSYRCGDIVKTPERGVAWAELVGNRRDRLTARLHQLTGQRLYSSVINRV